MPRPLIYIVRAELAADFIEPHHEWYARKHAPDVLGVGFLSARGYDATTVPHMWNIYEVPNVEIFSLDIYNNMHKNDPFVAQAIPKLQGRTVSVFTQVIIAGADGRDIAGCPTFSGPRLVSLRFDAPGDAGQTKEWFRASVVPSLAGKPGIHRIRLWEQQQSHPKWPTTEPRWSVAVETRRDADDALVRGVLDRAAQALPAQASKIDVADKRYALVREDLFDRL
jgi:hypothetical protein